MRASCVALALLALIHLGALAADVVAPYAPGEQAREFAYAPPTRLRFVDRDGRVHVRPFVYRLVPVADAREPFRYREDPASLHPLKLFVRAGGRRPGWRLFGVDPPMRIMLLGADAFGRDQFSRLVHGGRISLFAGLLATLLATAVGLAVGLVAGATGRIGERAATFACDVTLSLPWVYLLLAARAALPLSLPPVTAFFAIALVVGLVGWGQSARLVRGAVSATMTLEFVASARANGASTLRLLRTHLLPHAWPVAAAQASLLLPQFVLAEITLSFFGLGVGEPTPSWGALLAMLQQYGTLARAWWLALPAIALLPVFLLYYVLARESAGGLPSR